MLKEIKELYPEWTKEEYLRNNSLNLCLTNDIDSLMSCILLTRFDLPIEYFYSFNKIYGIEKVTRKKCIGVDMDLSGNGKCFGNHCVLLSGTDKVNENCANINNINNINRIDSYYSKFAGSTVMQILGLYNIDVEKMNDQQKLLICAIDSFFIPFKLQYRDFRPAQRKYLNQLGLGHLGEFIEFYIKKSGYDEFYNINKKYGLSELIQIDNKGMLTTKINLRGLSDLFGVPFALPNNIFYQCGEFENKKYNLSGKSPKTKDDIESNIFSLAITSKDFVCYSVPKKK